MNILRSGRCLPSKINENLVQRGIMIFAILLAWRAPSLTERTGVELHLYL